jgi:peptidoglycan/LPS O-acetylase OafA/YrhL
MGRAVAAILVVLLHLGNAVALDKYFGVKGFSIPFSFGGGVEFFFVLSGFIIFHAHKNDINRPEKIFSYAKKRLTRIYPTYWIIFLSVFFLALSSSLLRNTVPHDFWIIIKSLLLIPQDKNITNVWGTGTPVIDVAWTLHYEMIFYLFFSLLILNKWLGIISGTSLLLLSITLSGNSSVIFPLSFINNYYIFLFLMGMIVSLILSSKKTGSSKPALLLGLGIIIFIFTIVDFFHTGSMLGDKITISYGIASSFLILGLVQFEKIGYVIGGQKFFQVLGSSSYALYLTHYPIISILCKLLSWGGANKYGYLGAVISYLFILIFCIFSAIIFHFIIEKPVIKWLRSPKLTFIKLRHLLDHKNRQTD